MANSPFRLLLLIVVSIAIGACAGGGGGSSQPPAASAGSGAGPVTTPQDAMAAIAATDPRFATIKPYDPDLIGQSSWYKATPASGVGAFVVEVFMGWGDCPSGCIEKHFWDFAVAPDGTVTLQGERGDAVPSDGGGSGGGAGEY